MDILEQIEQHHEKAEQITAIFELLYHNNDICSLTAIEVLEKTAKDNRLGDEDIPSWLYECISYDDLCEYIESLHIFECGNDFIKLEDNEYYYIRDIVNLVEGIENVYK